MARPKKLNRSLREEQEWEPPNWYYNYQSRPDVSTKRWNELDNNIKTGIHNFNIQNCKCLGRFPIWPEWNKISDITKQRLGLYEFGRAYAADITVWRRMILANNFPLWTRMYGRDIIDPGERNKAYCVTGYPFYWGNIWQGHQYLDYLDTVQQGSPNSEPWGTLRPYMVRENEQQWDGMRIEIDPQGYIEYTYAEVSPNCKAIKVRRI